MSAPSGVPRDARPSRQPQGYTFWVIGDRRALLRDAYHTFLTLRWSASIVLIALAFVTINLGFATIYDLVGGVEGARPGSFWDAFVFSVQTLGTIGYGVMTPRSTGANAVMIVESITSIIFAALSTGLLFAKFSRPTARVEFTSRAVVAMHDGQPTLMFRVGNRRSNVIVEATLRVIAGMLTVTREGDRFYKMHDLRLVRDRMAGMRRGWNVMHVIDATSPLHGLDADGLARAEVELDVSLVGYDSITMQTIHALHTYTDQQIKLGHRFVDTIRTLPDGDIIIDLRQFDAIVPDGKPRDSVAS
jgi:inward rectifier potassium channel